MNYGKEFWLRFVAAVLVTFAAAVIMYLGFRGIEKLTLLWGTWFRWTLIVVGVLVVSFFTARKK